MRTSAALAVLGLILVLALACNGGSDAETAADFTMPLYSGAEHFGGAAEVSLSDLDGRPVIVNFWAPLCPPCRAEMPHFQEVWEELQAEGSDAMVLGVDVGSFTLLGDRPQSIEFLETIDLTYPVGEAQDRRIIMDYSVRGMPTTVFINADGAIHRTWGGAITKGQLDEVIDEVLG
ncbi:MAG: TlpA disulfide reductase family protein [Chloroflexota bacterium]|nr:TlpA disulfide reductase family protein [Chloroflexota bacterium]MDE2968683.1 TlpA disulfide reductase family protein [Chloroflexota bacterium]